MNNEELLSAVQTQCDDLIVDATVDARVADMVTVEVTPANLLALCLQLRDDKAFQFVTLCDVCGVDYADYGVTQWRQDIATAGGYSRAVNDSGEHRVTAWDKPRYAAVYHLLSLAFNCRVRLKVYLEPEPILPSVIDIWPAADWFEREAFDLFGIVFEGHPDLRRLLTDYGFNGHPFRKDFPLIGEVEMRYDAKRQACVYEPVSIQPRTLVPKVIRQDNRYKHLDDEEGNPYA